MRSLFLLKRVGDTVVVVVVTVEEVVVAVIVDSVAGFVVTVGVEAGGVVTVDVTGVTSEVHAQSSHVPSNEK